MSDKPNVARNEAVLDVKVFSPLRVFYEGKAKSLSAVNASGPLDVLPLHIAFFSLLVAGDVHINTGEQWITVPITHGVMHVRNNKLTLFVFGTVGDDQAAATESV